MTRKC